MSGLHILEEAPATHPLREEIRSSAHLAAAAGEAAPVPGAEPWLLAGLGDQEAFLERAAEHFRSGQGQETLSVAAEWVLDNFYQVQQTFRAIRNDMPVSYYRQLPKLTGGPLQGYPRILDLAQRLVVESNARLDLDYVQRFIHLYQEIQPLTTGELWGLPVMLRWSILAVLAGATSEITGLTRRAGDSGSASGPLFPSLSGLPTGDEVVASCFSSLRAIANQDWRNFFESVSHVERVLRTDPCAVYPRMDRMTRDRYRGVIEDLAAASGQSESDVAQTAVALARDAWPDPPSDRENPGKDEGWAVVDVPPTAHVGYYLMDHGRAALEARIGNRPSLQKKLARWTLEHPSAVYMGSILLLALLMAVGSAVYAAAQSGSVLPVLVAAAVTIMPALAVAIALVDWVVTLAVPPRILPKLDLSGQSGAGGIPDSCRTLVVIPALLGSASDVTSLLRQIELHYLRNRGPNLYFALLTDFTDAVHQHMPGDDELLEQQRAGIARLNERYAAQAGSGSQVGPFFMFHRERRWNEKQNRWMGWERKRGKLHELNRWLRGATDTSIVTIAGPVDELRQVRYVITLDSDTILGSDGARSLVGTLAHPLNRAQADPRTGRVLRGHGLLQPRTEITPTSANCSHFSRIFAGDIGLDLYTNAVSNVYQDLFGSGVYVGKGIYDIDAFENSLAGRVPENTLLSHDTFEGIHVRVGLVTDIVVYEDYPPTYLAHMRRLHRWTRGDWQLLPWLLPRRLKPAGLPQLKAGFGLIDTWKLLDNLRRSLLSPALLLMLVAGWILLPGSAWVWTAAALSALAVPALIGSLTPFARGPSLLAWRQSVSSLRFGLQRWLLAIAFLPFEAIQMLDAVARSLVRVMVTRRRLLEWLTAARSAQREASRGDRRHTWRGMLSAVLVALVIGVLILRFRPESLPVALPLLLGWVLSPEIALAISKPLRHAPAPITRTQRLALRSLARRTWLFFEDFVGPEDHWLPPDHYQETPLGKIAPYTSPTNIGLLMLSTLAAYDLGYIGTIGLVSRLRATFESLEQLERFRGHFLNWYDTRNLTPLLPRYVSTVDSGNLAASLCILHQACQRLRDAPVFRWSRFEGMADTFGLLDDFLGELRVAPVIPLLEEVRLLARDLRDGVRAVEADPVAWRPALDYVAGEGWTRLETLLTRFVAENAADLGTDVLSSLRIVVGRISNQIYTFHRAVERLLPGLVWLRECPSLFRDPGMSIDIGEPLFALVETLRVVPSFAGHPAACMTAEAALDRLLAALNRLPAQRYGAAQLDEARASCEILRERLRAARALGEDLLSGLLDIAVLAETYFREMDFGFLFEPRREVFHIGYNVTAGKLDPNFYDLLASEARIASLVALARREVPRSHWLHLARPITQVNGARVLLSWSATMFEYLMPSLFMRSYAGTLLHESATAAVDIQIAHGHRRGLPWGISESGYYAFDSNHNYQYRAFGVPGLGFKRNLAEDSVVAPYASLLALSFRPEEVVGNLAHLTRLGALGIYGFYEAIDFTSARLPLGRDHAVVREYMTHHQGMILLALDNYLSEVALGQDAVMPRRFHADPRLQSVDLLLQERAPMDVPLEFPQPGDMAPAQRALRPVVFAPWEAPVGAPVPQVHYLSNGRYSTLITAAGGGFSRWGDFDLTRWRADATREDWGTWLYVQDRDSGKLWSAGYQPTGVSPATHDVHFYAHKAEFRRIDDNLALTLEVAVAADDDLEIRRVTLHNQDGKPRRLVLTSYAEVVMADQATDQRHPAFNKLFIESEYVPELDALVFRRRPRSESDDPVFVAHFMLSAGRAPGLPTGHESDRATFLGRRGAGADSPLAQPVALAAVSGTEPWLSGGVGATLDPVMSLQRAVELQEGDTAQLAILTAVAASRAELLALVGRYQTWAAIEHAIGQARSRSELELRQSDLSTVELERFQALLSVLLYPYHGLRAEPHLMAANTRGQPALWAHGISGDYPILLLAISEEEGLVVVQELLQAHAYWRKRGLKIDLVILNTRQAGYNQELRDQIQRILVQMHSETWINQRGGIFILYASQLSEADSILLQAAARVVLDADAADLTTALASLRRQPPELPPLAPSAAAETVELPLSPVTRPAGLLFDNGFGGFSPDGREYIIYLDGEHHPPAPWVNVIANPEFGFLVSESGSATTWALNSGENRLTPWYNDPVIDPSGEVLYLRDEETTDVWTPTPRPAGAPLPYLVRHGAGYTIFEHASHGLRQQLRMFAPPDAPVKIVHLRLQNPAQRPRRLTATFYAEWVLGVTRDAGAQHIIPDFDDRSQALLARNPWCPEFGERVAFAAPSRRLHGLTADRSEFIGRLGTLQRPAALGRIGLSGSVRAGLDPCAALQVHVDLPPGGEDEIWFLLGQGASRSDAVALAARYQDLAQVEQAWQSANDFWSDLLGAVEVHTPDPALDLLLNRWLLYQSLSCRIWGRSAFYQSSGAFGFRDQLQDVMALIHAAPELARRHILDAARRQFEAGDVLHWWHPPSGRGVRTRCSDDLLWLPYVTAHYVAATGDNAILAERMPFLQAPPLAAGEEDRYGEYPAGFGSASLYDHCRRALERGMTAGPHSLPLMGSGDWNDGMNRVGAEGQGESVWLGWFLYATLMRFADLCYSRGDAEQAAAYREKAVATQEALERHAWDGEWYLRAFYDDGSPLGSSRDTECRIDAIAQSWAVLSHAGDPKRAEQAMDAVLKHLVSPEARLLLLFTPPFDKTARDPGYIKGYLPGIRENGGQYTHAAVWTTWAFAESGRPETAESLFRMLNPIYHADTPAAAARYRVEPYVVAADIYGVVPHTGRGGWTWYTGSAAWMYRLGIERILGLRRVAGGLLIEPCLPPGWPGYEASYRYGATTYAIRVSKCLAPGEGGVETMTVDGREVQGRFVALHDDGAFHRVTITLC